MKFQRKRRIAAALSSLLCVQLTLPLAATAEDAGHKSEAATATPIEHLIVIIGENRTFDNVYGTYEPKHGQTVSNLLSRGIVNEDGSPGPNASLARQFQIATINPVSYFVSTTALTNPGKSAFSLLPTPEAGFASPQPVTETQFLN